MKTIVGTNRYSGAPLEIVLSEVPEGFVYRSLEEQSEACLLAEAAEADYLLAGGRLKIGRSGLERAGKLKMIQRSGVGLDSLDLTAIREAGVPLYVNQGVNAESVAEHALLLILACLRRLTAIDADTKNGVWKKQEQGVRTAELKGKTVGIVGMGNVARTLVGLLAPFRVKILYCDIKPCDPGFEQANGMRFTSLEELLGSSDVVTIHCALTEDTRHMIREETIRRMKDGAILVNTARGEIVDAADTAAALSSGKLSFAGLDVHGREPIPDDYPLKGLENVILTPHIGGVTNESFRGMMRAAFRNIRRFERGELEEIAQFRYL